MAHFAELDNNNIVKRVVVVNNNELIDEQGIEQEQKGIDFLKSLFDGIWVQTSCNGSFRKTYAGVGFFYDKVQDAFIPPKPYDSWTFDDTLWSWEPPVTRPESGHYVWNESEKNWTEVK